MTTIDGLETRAKTAFVRQQWSEAVDLYRQLCQARPHDIPAKLKLAYALDQIKERAAARIIFMECSQHHPALIEAHIEAGTFFQRTGSIGEAATYFGRALCVEPAHLGALQAFEMMGLSKREQIDHYCILGGLVGADAYRNATSVPRAILAWPMIEWAMAAMRKQAWQVAEQRLATVLRYAPNHVGMLVQCGHARREQGKLGEAVHTYRRALILSPRDPDIYLHLGHAFKTMDYVRSAHSAYSASLMLRPGLAAAQSEVEHTRWLLETQGADLDSLAIDHAGPADPASPSGRHKPAHFEPDPELDERQQVIFHRIAGGLAFKD